MKSNLFDNHSGIVSGRGIHLDLKGLAPTFSRLLELVKLFKKLKFQTILVEWEDMFPWTCDQRMRNTHAYTEAEILEFAKICQACDLSIIPLVQSLGHAENVLRQPGNESLREMPNRTDVFHPLNPRAPELVRRMVEDVLNLIPNVDYVHLGGDEVYTLGKNPRTKNYLKQHGEAALYMLQLKPTMDLLKSKSIRPMLWHDEVVRWEDDQIRQFSKYADLVVWGYTGDPRDAQTYHFRLPHVEKLSALGCQLWGTTAYKGADGPKANLTNTLDREKATIGWTKLASKFELKGVFATGWSRYASGRIQVTPIDSALDSMVNTAAILYNGDVATDNLAVATKWLEEAGEGGIFNKLRTLLSKLTTHTDNSWNWVRELEEQVANLTVEPARSNSGIEEIIFELFNADIAEIKKISEELADVLAGYVVAPQNELYCRPRLLAIESAAESLRLRLELDADYKLMPKNA
jgi:hexosaminidase